jgi:hypothetical protein
MVGVAVVLDAAFAIEDEHLLSVRFLECVTVGLRWIVHIAVILSAYVDTSTQHQQSTDLTF